MGEIAEKKQRLRKEILSARKARTTRNTDLITENLLRLVFELHPQRVAVYRSYSSEPDTAEFINKVSVPVMVPITMDEENLAWVYDDADDYGQITDGDLMIIPALAVDKSGNRLGRGKAYFDRELATLPKSVQVYAVVFDSEFLDEIPTEEHDRKVNGVVTEAGIHKIN
ncbi:MAG: 5-formyltetrahydrofolate cyclo-ligase [Micrococcales bacterium]|nr:5-formyltetrahydrofolate cyclo-ligase [Micrococcales bacterium]